MGQYWLPVNLDKRECINPHRLGAGLKLWEQLANTGVGRALVVLMAAMPEYRGGGDFQLEPATQRKTDREYAEVAQFIIGRWAGDRIALVGDYAEDGDLPNSPDPASKIYKLCNEQGHWEGDTTWATDAPPVYRDVTDAVCCVIERELDGFFENTPGWRDYHDAGDEKVKKAAHATNLKAALKCVRALGAAASPEAAEESRSRALLLEEVSG